MRYQCLVLDHDDTVVNSTATINYPAFVQTLQTLRPDVHMTLDDFFSYSFEPGFGALCSDILGFSDAEMDIQYQTWLDYVRTHVPDTFPGMRDLLQRFHAAGGHICVVSHSVPENILRDYRARPAHAGAHLRLGFRPRAAQARAVAHLPDRAGARPAAGAARGHRRSQARQGHG